MTIGHVIDSHRLVVCVGTGGVGKTTVAAAIALGAAQRGRRAMVLTIDPARALARALGLSGLSNSGQRVPAETLRDAGLPADIALDAAMLDQKAAWDEFIRRHAPSAASSERILANPFYDQLSTSFSGSTEYMAVEEMCRLAESGDYDLLVLDTPPSAHALDFLEAPQRIDRLFDRRLASWLTRPYEAAGRGAWRMAGAAARLLLRRFERAAGRNTLRDVSAFFVALDALLDDVARRTMTARNMLADPSTAFVLVTGAGPLVQSQTHSLVARMAELDTEVAGVVVNRVTAAFEVDDAAAARVLAELDAAHSAPEAADWLRREWASARARSVACASALSELADRLPATIARAEVAEAAGDLHSMSDLAYVARALWGNGA